MDQREIDKADALMMHRLRNIPTSTDTKTVTIDIGVWNEVLALLESFILLKKNVRAFREILK